MEALGGELCCVIFKSFSNPEIILDSFNFCFRNQIFPVFMHTAGHVEDCKDREGWGVHTYSLRK